MIYSILQVIMHSTINNFLVQIALILEIWSSSCCVLLNMSLSFKKYFLGFPGGAVVESLPANAGDTGSSPGLGRSHMPRSSWTREPQLLSLRVWSLCPATGGAAIVKGPRTVMKSGPRTMMKSGPHLP